MKGRTKGGEIAWSSVDVSRRVRASSGGLERRRFRLCFGARFPTDSFGAVCSFRLLDSLKSEAVAYSVGWLVGLF